MSIPVIEQYLINAVFYSAIESWKGFLFSPEASFSLRILLLPATVCVCLPACLSVCLSVCLCVNHSFVGAITHDPFKLLSLNLDQRCKTHCLRCLLWSTFTFKIKLDKKIQIYPILSLSDHNSSPIKATTRVAKWLNYDPYCYLFIYSFIYFFIFFRGGGGGAIHFGLKGQIWLKIIFF